MRILFLSAWFPYPPDNGSKLRILNLLRGLARTHEVTLFSLSDHPDEPTPPALAELCRKVVGFPSPRYRATSGRALLGLLSSRPRVLVDRHMPALEDRVRRATEGGQFDLIIASQWYMAAYLENIPGVPAIFEEVEVGVFHDHVARAANRLGKLRHKLTNLKLRTYFGKLLARFGACTVASVEEGALLRKMVPSYAAVAVIPNGVSLTDYADVAVAPQPDRLVFAGSFTFNLNHEAMCWFTGQVLPLIHAQRPDVRLAVTGNHAGLPLPYLQGVELTGFLPDVRPAVASAWASLAPLQAGGGTRLKILEAMALGTPVIATSKGAEGLDVVSGEHLLIADSPADFAAATLKLLSDPVLRRRLSENALELVRRKYDWSVLLPRFLALAERVASREPIDSLVEKPPGTAYPPAASAARVE